MRRVLLPVGLLLLAGGIFLYVRSRPQPAPPVPPATAPAVAIAKPTSKPATVPVTPVDYMGVVRLNYPDFPTTQPLAIPLAMTEAARLIIPDPIYVDRLGELWITRSDAETTSNVLKHANDRSTHVTKEHVVFVHRYPDASGVWQPQLVCKKADGGYEIVTLTTRQNIAGSYNYRWDAAFSWNDRIVVPTDRGLSILQPSRLPFEVYHELVPAADYDANKYSAVCALLDWRGLITWIPWDDNKLGSKGAARFVEGKWTNLDAETHWPEKIIHLVPLLDGSILQLIRLEDQSVDLQMTAQDPAELDEKAIETLVDQLSDPQANAREEAFSKLSRYGVGSWPILDRLMPNQPPEARFRLELLLASRTKPNLGGMVLQKGTTKVIARGELGAAMLYAEKGVSIPRPDGVDSYTIAPAWISIMPGQSISLAFSSFVEEIKKPGVQLQTLRGEWIINDATNGPRWWIANHFSGNLLKPEEMAYHELVGVDGRGRWFFRKNLADDSPTLILDPTLPTPIPRLPVWTYKIEGGEVGWSELDWPAIKLGGAWALAENEWQPIDEKKGKFITRLTEPPNAAAFARAMGAPLLMEKDGTHFYGGLTNLKMVTADGKRVIWNLPPEAVGHGPAVLIRAGENRLFLFNDTGRMLRLRQTPDGDEPFKLEATFTKRIPKVLEPQRIWLDPAGRIIIAYNKNTLAVCFPTGRIPPDLAMKMTAKDLEDANEQ